MQNDEATTRRQVLVEAKFHIGFTRSPLTTTRSHLYCINQNCSNRLAAASNSPRRSCQQQQQQQQFSSHRTTSSEQFQVRWRETLEFGEPQHRHANRTSSCRRRKRKTLLMINLHHNRGRLAPGEEVRGEVKSNKFCQIGAHLRQISEHFDELRKLQVAATGLQQEEQQQEVVRVAKASRLIKCALSWMLNWFLRKLALVW